MPENYSINSIAITIFNLWTNSFKGTRKEKKEPRHRLSVELRNFFPVMLSEFCVLPWACSQLDGRLWCDKRHQSGDQSKAALHRSPQMETPSTEINICWAAGGPCWPERSASLSLCLVMAAISPPPHPVYSPPPSPLSNPTLSTPHPTLPCLLLTSVSSPQPWPSLLIHLLTGQMGSQSERRLAYVWKGQRALLANIWTKTVLRRNWEDILSQNASLFLSWHWEITDQG